MTVLSSMKAVLFLVVGVALADHSCTSEVASACPERPGTDTAACLKDVESHDTATEISSECTDFIAVNTACREDIEKKCDEAFFTDDTVPCLTQWNERDDLTERCQGVLKWAVPEDDDLDDLEEATDELGLTEDEAAEQDKEWKERRKAGRGDAIELLKMKEADRKKEEDRVALEEFKEKDPEGYESFIQQQEEEAKQKKEFARLERMRAAAWERKKREEAGLPAEDEVEQPKAAKGSKKKKKGESLEEESADFGGAKAGTKKKGSVLYSLASFAFVGLVIYGIYYLAIVAPSQPGSRGGRGSGKKGKKSR